jgi:chromosomal replication initiation ATPase DnaA
MPDAGGEPAPASDLVVSQLPLDLTLEPQWGREDFLVGAPNEAAFRLIEGWSGWPSRLLVLAGPPGSGKTHLSHIWRSLSGAVAPAPESLSVEGVAGLAGHHVVIDGAGPDIDQPALFHLINQAQEAGKSLLVTVRAPPSDWEKLLPDLASRLRRALSAVIDQPDDALIRALLVKLLLDRQLMVDTGLVDYAAVRMERSFAAARRFVAALDRLSLSSSRRPGRRLAGEVLDWMATNPD